MTVSNLLSFFCISKVMAMLSADSKSAEGAKIRCPFLKNLIFCRHSSFVRLSSLLGTVKYLQEQHAKNAAPIASCPKAISNSVSWRFASLSSTINGRAFCCFCQGSLFLYVQYCLDKRMLNSLSLSFVGFCLSAARKVCTTCETAPQTVPSTSTLWQSFENHPYLTAIANVLSMEIHSFCVSWSMKRSMHPMDLQYVVQCCHAWASPSCIPLVAAHSRAIAAAVKSARNWSHWVSVISWNGLASDLGRGSTK